MHRLSELLCKTTLKNGLALSLLLIWKQNKQEIKIAARLLHGPQYFFSTFDGAQLFSSVLCYAKLSCLPLFNK